MDRSKFILLPPDFSVGRGTFFGSQDGAGGGTVFVKIIYFPPVTTQSSKPVYRKCWNIPTFQPPQIEGGGRGDGLIIVEQSCVEKNKTQ